MTTEWRNRKKTRTGKQEKRQAIQFAGVRRMEEKKQLTNQI